MFHLFTYFSKKEKYFIALALVSICVQVWLNLKIPDYMNQVTKLVETKGSAMNDILGQGCFMLICAAGSALAAIFTAFFASRCASDLAQTLRSHLFNKTINFAMEDIDRFSTASLVDRSTNDITQVQNLVSMGLSSILMAPILAVWAVAKIMGKAWQWSSITAGSVAIIILYLLISVRIILPRFKKIQSLTDNINRIMREQLTGIRVVRAYNAEKYEEKKFGQANDDLTNNNLTAYRTTSLMNPLLQMINSGLTLAIYWTGAYLIIKAGRAVRMNIFADMVVFSQYAIQIVMAFMLMSTIFLVWPRAQVSADRINEVLRTESKIKDGKGGQGLVAKKGAIEFRNVSFTYPHSSSPTLKKISFGVRPGQTVAIIGAIGSGKTTLLNLIPRFYDVSQGEVLVDGQNVKNYRRDDLRRRIGYATQKAILLNGTVKSNVQLGLNNAEDNEQKIKKALKIAQAEEFVSQMKGRENGWVAQGGANLSGGQKQRISIARSLARKPEILLFDDSFSALDYETDRKLRKQLRLQTKGITKIIVAQRIGTIKDADQIIVLAHGKIVGRGRHKELLQTCQTYREIAESQLSKKELAENV